MAKLLLMNPRRRKASVAQLRARKAFAATYGGGAKRRRRNPAKARAAAAPRSAAAPSVVVLKNPAARRRRNPVSQLSAVRRMTRRRRNPISLGRAAGYIDMLKNAAIGGAGAIAVDLTMGQINKFLPSSLQSVPGVIDLGTATKVVITAALGKLLNGPTRGLSMKMAQGSLVVQAHAIMAQLLPGSMTLGYASPARVVDGNNRIGPNRFARYTRPGVSPVLSQYIPPGQTPLLSGGGRRMMPAESVQRRETVLR